MSEFLDYLCAYCENEEHDTCWFDLPDLNCVCCLDTIKILEAPNG